MFETEALRKSVREALVDVPKDSKVAILTVANQNGVKFVTAIKIDDNWDIQGFVQVQKDTVDNHGVNVDWGVAVQKVW